MVSVSRYDDAGDRTTHDLVLAADGDVCHVFLRDPEVPGRLVAHGLGEDEWRSLVTKLAAPA